MKKKIYLSGALEIYGMTYYSDPKKWCNRVKEYFNTYSDNFICISPIDYYSNKTNYDKKEKEIFNFVLRKIMESNIILVNLDNIKHSVETYDEIFYAYLHNKPIIGFFEHISTNEKGLKSFIHPWKYIQIDRIETGYNALTDACDYIKNYYGEEGDYEFKTSSI